MSWLTEQLGSDPGGAITEELGAAGDYAANIYYGQITAFNNWLDDYIEDLIDVPETDLGKGTLLNKQGNVNHLPVIYGERMVGGLRVFVGVSGSENEYLHIVLALCEGEIDSINDVYINDIISTDAKYSGLITLTKYTGTDAQAADADLVSNFTDWTSNHKLSGVAYLHAKLKWDNEAFGGFPNITCDVKGRKILDLRDSTTAWSDNPALCIYDYLTNARYGKGLATTAIDTQSIEDAADYCETQIESYSGGANINKFACNGRMDTAKSVMQNVRYLLTSCRGMLPYTGGTYKLIIEKNEASSFSFNEDNIIGGWSFSGGSKRARQNRIKVKYINPDRNWQEDIATTESATYLAEDNNLLLSKDVSLPFETSPYRALDAAEMIIKKSREQISASFVATIEAMQVEIGEIVDITHITPGWTTKLFRVVSLNLLTSGNMAISVIEHQASVYDRTVPVGLPTPPDTDLPDPLSVVAPTGLALVSGASEEMQGTDGTVIPRIKATWTASADIYVTSYEVVYKKNADSNWIPAAMVQGRTTVETYISPVVKGVSYDVGIRAINSLGFRSAWLTVNNHAVTRSTVAAGIAGQGDLALLDVVGDSKLDRTTDPVVIVTDDINNDAVTNAKIDSLIADKITAGTITGSTIQTASSGQRMVIGEATDDEMVFYETGTTRLATIGISSLGGDDVIAYFGHSASTKVGVYAEATGGSRSAIYGKSNGTNSPALYGQNLASLGIGVEGNGTFFDLAAFGSGVVGLKDLSADPSGSTSVGRLYTKNKKLYFKDPDGNVKEIQFV